MPLQIQSILVPLDFSAPSKKALEYALAVARKFKAKLTLLNVVEPMGSPDFAASFPLVMENDRLMASAKTRLENTMTACAVPRSMVKQILVVFGRSFHEITEVAYKHKADLIIISTHGYTGLKHAFLGSTAERVV